MTLSFISNPIELRIFPAPAQTAIPIIWLCLDQNFNLLEELKYLIGLQFFEEIPMHLV